MTYSKKLEDIPKEHLEGLKTYLNRIRTSNTKYARIPIAASETKLDKATIHAIFSKLVSQRVLAAKVRVRCPDCNASHGIYSRKSEIPSEIEICFSCGDEFDKQSQRNWEVIYEIVEPDSDFFQTGIGPVKRYLDAERDVDSSFFQSELDRFRSMDNPQQRGIDFDFLMGLLFQQLPGVEVRVQPEGNSGEVDIFMSCLEAPDWLKRLVGSATVIENKWVKDPIQKNEVIDFHAKAEEIPNCKIAYFVSMSGFSRRGGKELGALPKLRNLDDPDIVDFWEKDVEEMFNHGTPEKLLKDNQMM